METMLRRLIGPEIEFEIECGARPVMVMADSGQIEQVVLNLVINARDAMPEGGRLTVRVDEVDLDEAAAVTLTEGRAGRYARLSVSDTGTGMSEQTRAKLFEPFFTTKEQGKGHRPRPVDRVRHREAERRVHQRLERARTRRDVFYLSPGGGRRGTGAGRSLKGSGLKTQGLCRLKP